jgi:D-alanine-D-alanine ligase
LGAPKILTFGSKWRKDSIYFDNSFAVCPADIDERMFSDICDIAIKSCNVIDCEGYARVDFRQDEKGNNYVLEVNANPDLSDDAGFVLQAKQIGLSYRDLIGEIVRIGCENNCLG